MPVEDFRINAAVRTTLVRFWIDTSKLDHGSVNGVVYLRGRLRKETLRVGEEDPRDESLAFIARRLDRELRTIHGVRDVVCDFENLKRARGRWVTRTAP